MKGTFLTTTKRSCGFAIVAMVAWGVSGIASAQPNQGNQQGNQGQQGIQNRQQGNQGQQANQNGQQGNQDGNVQRGEGQSFSDNNSFRRNDGRFNDGRFNDGFGQRQFNQPYNRGWNNGGYNRGWNNGGYYNGGNAYQNYGYGGGGYGYQSGHQSGYATRGYGSCGSSGSHATYQQPYQQNYQQQYDGGQYNAQRQNTWQQGFAKSVPQEHPDRPVLGIRIRNMDNGVRVTEVRQDSPAMNAGLQEGDRVVSVNGQQVQQTDDLLCRLRDMKQQDDVSLVVDRNGQEQEMSAQLTSYREAFGDGRHEALRPNIDEQQPRAKNEDAKAASDDLDLPEAPPADDTDNDRGNDPTPQPNVTQAQ